MAKIQKISNDITPFAGISFINNEFNRSGLGKLIDNQLGMRVSTIGYQYSDIFCSWFNVFLCGGDCAEDIAQHLRSTLENIPGNKVPSPDTLLRSLEELATENTTVISTSGHPYQFNINEKLNDLNVKSLILTQQLTPGKYYDFDYDNQIIAHEKWDAKKTYKMNTGYFGGAATIGNKIVYYENRDGNANVKLAQSETLKRAYKVLNDNGIKVSNSRMDAGSYSKEIIATVAENSLNFYIRANRSQILTEQLQQVTEWKTVEINFKAYQVASIAFTQFFEDKNYRLVVAREKVDDQQLDLFEGEKFNYRCILTNDHDKTEKEVIEFYNQRGASEKTFDIQNNDFGWGHLPCSEMKKNTVYLIMTAMLKNFYNYIVSKVSKTFKNILPSTRLKRFIFRFICVAGKWVRQGRQNILKLYTNQPYDQLKFY
ncbi:hypothetical protein FACS189413_19290 [Bacteroidia bacterium]|nr:hypothetical protein FACS189413_19290 [Bacteroidia bacterium]